MSFETFQLHEKIMAGVRGLGYTEPTPIQAQAIPPVLEGSDVMGLAQTGTGKTAAFVLPLLQRLMDGPRGKVRALILAPTRELAEQTHEVINKLGRKVRLRSARIYGGVSIQPQLSALRRGVEVVTACPGRLLDHIDRGTIDLAQVEVLILDEADRMFDMGFLPDIKKIIKKVPKKRQTLLFSATMPKDIKRLADDILHKPVTVRIGHTAPAATVAHTFYPVAMDNKQELLQKIITTTETESVLVFTRTKLRVKRVAKKLGQAGHRVAELHGDMSQNKRQNSLDGFRKGRYAILVATDVAARGIDVSTVSHVINYDMPDTVDAYTHRIGRTGRACATGDAFTFVTKQDRAIARSLEKVLGKKIQYDPAGEGSRKTVSREGKQYPTRKKTGPQRSKAKPEKRTEAPSKTRGRATPRARADRPKTKARSGRHNHPSAFEVISSW